MQGYSYALSGLMLERVSPLYIEDCFNQINNV